MGSGAFAALSFFLLVIVTREYGVTKAAAFGVAITTSQLFFRVGIFAVRQYQITDIGEEFLFSDYFAVKLATTSICLFLFFVYVVFTGTLGGDFLEFLFLFLFYQLLSLDDLYQNRFFQKGRLDQSGKAKCLVIGGYLAVFLGLLVCGALLVWALAAAFFVSCIVSYFYCFRTEKIPAGFFAVTKMKRVLMMCLPAFLANFLLTMVNSFPKYTVFYMCSREESGYMNNIFAFLNIVELVGSFVYYPFIPDITESLAKDKKRARKLLFKILAGILFFGVFIAVFLVAFGGKLFGMIYHADFSGYTFEIVYVVGVCGMSVAFISLFYWIPVILRDQKVIAVIFTIGFLVAFAGCILGTAASGMRGAMIGHSIGAGVMAYFLVVYFLEKTKE